MSTINHLYTQVYKKGNLFDVDKKLFHNPFKTTGKRPNSVAVMGGAFGDEGKGRITDELTSQFLNTSHQVIHYRDNGGANAGHTVEIGDTRIALHQLSSGVMQSGCTVISGKGMVIHPEDFVEEMSAVEKAAGGKIPAVLIIDEMASLSLDTHRALENVLKTRQSGSKGSTGRGIAPAYADLIYRHPVRMRDLVNKNWQKILTDHYRLYHDLISGLDFKLASVEVARLTNIPVKVGSLKIFLSRLETTRRILKPYIQPVYPLLSHLWPIGQEQSIPYLKLLPNQTAFVFEKAQALGLDARYGVYPDVTASDCSFEGIVASTEGIVQPKDIAVKAAVIKATYTSSVGTRIMPSQMPDSLANRIREDANEYGATTRRPRGIHYIDIPFLSFLQKVGDYDYLCPTHLDISYPEVPIKVCIAYTLKGKEVPYRPDQDYLLKLQPKFIELPSWDGKQVQKAKKPSDLPKATLQYLAFLTQALNTQLLMATTGPKRHQTIKWY